ncbi:hypothetical protein RB597_009466 [Gaeumannomyces tritici]
MPSSSSKPQGFYSSAFWEDYLATQHRKLPELGHVSEHCGSKRVVRFLGGNPGHMQLQGTNTYLVGTGRIRILIDTGEGRASWIINLTGYLDDHDISISHVLLTHRHGDHTGGLADLLLRDPDVLVHKNEPEGDGQRPIRDGQRFAVEGATLRAVLTPGHSSDHACFVLEEDDALFTGDAVLGHGYSVAEDLGAYTASLARMRALGCGGPGYPGHGEWIKDLPRVLDMYVAQRRARERRICAVLADAAAAAAVGHHQGVATAAAAGGGNGGLTVEDVGVRIYGEAARSPGAFDAALRPLLDQVLYMLADHGKVGSRLVGSGQTRHWFVTPGM